MRNQGRSVVFPEIGPVDMPLRGVSAPYSKALWDAISDADWAAALAIVEGSRDKPVDEWGQTDWELAAGELHLLNGDVEAAAATFRRLLDETAEAYSDPPKNVRAKASRHLALIEALGNDSEAKEWLDHTDQIAWGGCGNCDEPGRMLSHLQSIAYSASTSSEPYSALANIYDGRFERFEGYTIDPRRSEDWQLSIARASAALLFGARALSEGDTELAARAFAASVRARIDRESDWDPFTRLLAWAWLQRL